MRLDKFLKLTRLVKRRELANALCDNGGVSINDKVAKASAAVAVGQKLTLRFGNRTLTVEVLGLPMKACGNHTAAQAYILQLEEVRHKLPPLFADEGTEETTQ
jgi:ribosomal 50S subunit-recycling heat shock protein